LATAVFFLMLVSSTTTLAEVNKIQMKIGGYLCGM
jgi:hypothetical protein